MVARLARQWIKRTRNELLESAQVKCWMYIRGGSFGSFGSAVDKKNEK